MSVTWSEPSADLHEFRCGDVRGYVNRMSDGSTVYSMNSGPWQRIYPRDNLDTFEEAKRCVRRILARPRPENVADVRLWVELGDPATHSAALAVGRRSATDLADAGLAVYLDVEAEHEDLQARAAACRRQLAALEESLKGTTSALDRARTVLAEAVAQVGDAGVLQVGPIALVLVEEVQMEDGVKPFLRRCYRNADGEPDMAAIRRDLQQGHPVIGCRLVQRVEVRR